MVRYRPILRVMATIVLAGWMAAAGWTARAAETPAVFPIPQSIQPTASHFALDEGVTLIVPERPSGNDLALARFLAAELAERRGLALATRRVPRLPASGRFILLGTVDNPLIGESLSAAKRDTVRKLAAEGYVLSVGCERVIVAGRDEAGAFYGLQTLRQLIERNDGALRVRGVEVTDWPHEPFRGVRLYVPGPENITFFKRFLRDFVALHKFNKVILEMNVCMRLERHPELNAGWIDFARDLNATRRDRPDGPGGQVQDSAHHDAGDGAILDKDEVAGLVRYAAEHHIEVIPEIPSLTHSYYLLTRHRELAEIQEAEWPDTYCPSNPDVYPLLFDVLDEYVGVMQPKTIHIGHDEWRMPVGVCPRCKGKDQGALYVADVNKIHDYLARRGIRTALWGDHLLENVRGRGPQRKKSPAGYEYHVPGALTPEQVRTGIPKDILVLNWFWKEKDSQPKVIMGEVDDRQLAEFGFTQVYGNFEPDIEHYGRRSADPSVIGGVASSWAAATEANIGKDQIFDFLGVANLVWSRHWPETGRLLETVQGLMPEVRRNLSGKLPPSAAGDPVRPLEIASAFNVTPGDSLAGADLKGLQGGACGVREKRFKLAVPANGDAACAVGVMTGPAGKGAKTLPAAGPIAVGADASSLIFLHGCARPAGNHQAYRAIFNFDDTADLLGWYEVVYEDGLSITIPIRYGVNILAWRGWPDAVRQDYCYGADPVRCPGDGAEPGVTLFAYEWTNPRLGKVIKEVRLKGAAGFKDPEGRTIGENAVVLAGLSVVEQRSDLNAATALPRK